MSHISSISRMNLIKMTLGSLFPSQTGRMVTWRWDSGTVARCSWSPPAVAQNGAHFTTYREDSQQTCGHAAHRLTHLQPKQSCTFPGCSFPLFFFFLPLILSLLFQVRTEDPPTLLKTLSRFCWVSLFCLRSTQVLHDGCRSTFLPDLKKKKKKVSSVSICLLSPLNFNHQRSSMIFFPPCEGSSWFKKLRILFLLAHVY